MKGRVRALLVINVMLLVLFLCFSGWTATRIDWAAVGHSLDGAAPGYELAMVAAWVAVLLLRPVRLMMLIGIMSPQTPSRYGAFWSATLVAMGLNTIVPLRAGDIAMALVLNQRLGVRMPRAFSALVVDRFFDLATVIVLFVGALSVAPVAAAWTAGLVPSMLLALVGLVVGLWLVIHFRASWLRLVYAVLTTAAPACRERWGGQMEELLNSLSRIDRPIVLAKIIAISFLIWLVTTLSYWCGIAATWPSASLAAAAFTASAAALVFVIPVTPAGVGVFHGACVLALSVFDVPFGPALAFAISAHALQVVSVLMLAAIALFSQRLSLRSLLVPAETLVGPAAQDSGEPDQPRP